MSFSWRCPYCNHSATITESNFCSNTKHFNHGNKDGNIAITSEITVCPNPACMEYAIFSVLRTSSKDDYGNLYIKETEPFLMQWQLKPQSNSRQFPSYIPQPILDDYQEACLIKDLSPKASATLSRRCLQGIIRNYWGISKNRLVDEISELKGKIDQATWEAIDAVRSIGNIGAHMEKDINLIVDVEPQEAELLIGLIEILFKDWYVAKHERQQHLESIINVAQSKKQIKN